MEAEFVRPAEAIFGEAMTRRLRVRARQTRRDGRHGASPGSALERLKTPPQFWMHLQADWDLHQRDRVVSGDERLK